MEKRTNPPDKGYWSDKGSSMSVRCGRSDSKWMDKNFVEDFEPNSSDEDYVDQIFRRKPKDKGSSMSVSSGRSDSKWMDKNFVEDFEQNSSDEDYVDQIFRRKPKDAESGTHSLQESLFSVIPSLVTDEMNGLLLAEAFVKEVKSVFFSIYDEWCFGIGLLPWWNGDYTAQRDTARGDCYGLLVRLWCLYFVFLGPWFVMFLTVKTIPGQAFVCAALTETKVEKSKESFVTKDRDVHLIFGMKRKKKDQISSSNDNSLLVAGMQCGTEDER
ncbi:unnamed protein product [Ilex paraguariensis]|uniref:Uncharacterized protein n=1 Tax=Ilex paraguariensis TaxID=185542 RepID=A0ABC8TK48_9AQUA